MPSRSKIVLIMRGILTRSGRGLEDERASIKAASSRRHAEIRYCPIGKRTIPPNLFYDIQIDGLTTA